MTRILTEQDLHIVITTVDDAISRNWRREFPDAHVVRVPEPDPATWPDLERQGFIVKPAEITWRAPVGSDEEEFLGRMGKRERRKVRGAIQATTKRAIDLTVRTPLDAATLEEFLALYEEHVARIRNGIPFARKMQDQILAAAADYFAVCATDDTGALIGGGICAEDPETDMVRLRFTALAADERQGRLVRAIYMRACQEARDRGRSLFSLGTDFSLYGHICQPGLFTFKAKLGFTPVPTQSIFPGEAADEADLFLRMDALADPSLVIAYADGHTDGDNGGRERCALRMEVLTEGGDVDLSAYRAPFLSEVRTRTVPAH